MDANQYYQSLLQQGHSPENAAHFTSQYYPDFNSAIQGAGMIAPPPDMGLGGLGTSSMVAQSGSLAAGGVAAGAATTGAAAAGGTSIATIAVVSVLVLGGAGTAGYFIYDYLTEPDFYGVIYWDESGFGYQFSEDDLTMVIPAENNQDCEEITDMFDADYEYEDGLCYIKNLYSSYEVEDKGDYYKICASIGGESDCFKIYVGEKGLVLVTYLIVTCNPMVRDIEPPVLMSMAMQLLVGWINSTILRKRLKIMGLQVVNQTRNIKEILIISAFLTEMLKVRCLTNLEKN